MKIAKNFPNSKIYLYKYRFLSKKIRLITAYFDLKQFFYVLKRLFAVLLIAKGIEVRNQEYKVVAINKSRNPHGGKIYRRELIISGILRA